MPVSQQGNNWTEHLVFEQGIYMKCTENIALQHIIYEISRCFCILPALKKAFHFLINCILAWESSIHFCSSKPENPNNSRKKLYTIKTMEVSPGKWVLGRGENYDRLMNKNMLLECIVSIACKLDKNIWQKNWVKASIKLYLLWKQTRYPNHFYTNFTFVKHLLIHIVFVSVCIYHIHKFLIQSQTLNYINNVLVKFDIEINCIRKECVANNIKKLL